MLEEKVGDGETKLVGDGDVALFKAAVGIFVRDAMRELVDGAVDGDSVSHTPQLTPQ